MNVPTIVERLVGADFETPKKIEKISFVKQSPHLQHADYVNYNREHNVLQYWEDNETKKHIDNGFIPLSEEEMKELGEIF